MALDITKPVSTNDFFREIYKKLFGIKDETPTGSDTTGICGGNVAVVAGVTEFEHPSYIECTGNDGTITYVDEYSNTVANYPMTKGKTTNFRVKKVTAATATGLYRCYSK